MKKKTALNFVLGIVAVFVVIIVGITVFDHHITPNSNVISNPNSSLVKLSNSPYANYAYLISSNNLSSDAKLALTGFQLNKTANSDGTVTYTLTALKQGYYNQSYTLQPNQSLYFIEASLGDDNTADNGDYNLGDDFALVVDSNGYIIQGPN